MGKLTKHETDVADFALTFLGVGIHREDAQDKVFVLNVALLYKGAESLPVFGGVVCRYLDVTS